MSRRNTFEFLSSSGNVLRFRRTGSSDEVRFFVLEDWLFRVLATSDSTLSEPRTWSVAPGMDDLPYEGRDRLDTSPFSLPEFVCDERNGVFVVETDCLRAEIRLEGFRISYSEKREGGWQHLFRDRQTQGYNWDNSLGEGVAHYLEREPGERYFGLGDKSGPLDKSGRRYRMFGLDAMGYDAENGDPLYKHTPFYITHRSEDDAAYGLFYDNLSPAVFDLGLELSNYHGAYRYYRAELGDLDLYVIGGPHIRDVVKRFCWLTGRPPFAPRWSLGYSGSTMTYTDAPDAERQLGRFIEDCRSNDIPCDSFHLSSGYTTIGSKRYVFNWDRSKFPDPARFSRTFHDEGIRIVANIKPCLLDDHPDYEALSENGCFVKDRFGREPETTRFWDSDGAYLDFTNPDTIRWWKSGVESQLLAYDIDATWNDNNEYEIPDGEALVHGFGQTRPIGQLRPVMPLLMAKASAEAQREHSPNERPYVVSRSGSPGIQRYAQTWSGDNYTSWKTLRYNTKMGLGMSLSGMYSFGHDIGGFAGPAPEPELLVRWIQNGLLNPRFTIHSWNDDETVNEPWMYPEALPLIRENMRLRYYLLPYLYHLLYEAHTEYRPVVRPTFYDYQDDAAMFEESDDFCVGDTLLVAPVVERGGRERRVRLPGDPRGWFDFQSGEWFEGSRTVTLDAPLGRLPMLVRGDAILPVDPAWRTSAEDRTATRGLLLYPAPDGGEAALDLLEDDGISYRYLDTGCPRLAVRMRADTEQVEVQLSAAGDRLPYERVEVSLPPKDSRMLRVNGVSGEREGEVTSVTIAPQR